MVAIVTGAASGIGLATAKLFLEKGISVVGMSRRETMEDLGEQFTYVSGDVGCSQDRENLVATTLK